MRNLIFIICALFFVVSVDALLVENLSKSGTRLLLLSATGEGDKDPSLVTAQRMLTAQGVPFDLVAVDNGQGDGEKVVLILQNIMSSATAKAEGKTSTETVLVGTPLEDSNGFPLYSGVIVTSDRLAYQAADGAWYSALEWQEWVWLWTWESKFNVKTVSLLTWPSVQYGVDIAELGQSTPTTIQLTGAAREYAPFLPAGAELPLSEWYYSAKPCENCVSTCACTIEPWAYYENGHIAAAVRHVSWPGNRDELMFFMVQSQWYSYASILAHMWVNWVTDMAFVGSRRVLLSAQIDDLLLGTEAWDPSIHAQGTVSKRMKARDLNFARNIQNRVNAQIPGSDFVTEFAFNGLGVTENGGISGDKLFQKCVQQRDQFYWLTHTYTHLDLTYVKYQDPTECLGNAGLIGTPTTYEDANCELGTNLPIADALFGGVKCGTEFNNEALQDSAACATWSASSIVTPHVSGTHHEPSLRSMQEHGIDNMVGDNSKPWLFPFEAQSGGWYHGISTTVETHGKEGSFIIPRGATNVFYHVWNIDTIVDLYNWIYESVLGLSTIDQIYEREGQRVGKDMIDLKPQPHMFHQANLIRFGITPRETSSWMQPLGGRVSLLSLWLDAVLAEFTKYMNYPIKTLKQADLADNVKERMQRDACEASVHKLHVPQTTVGATRISAPVAVEVAATNGPCRLGVTGVKGLPKFNDAGVAQAAPWSVEEYTSFEATTWIDVPAGDTSSNPVIVPLDAPLAIMPVVVADVVAVCANGVNECQYGAPGSEIIVPIMVRHPLVSDAKRMIPNLVFAAYAAAPGGSVSVEVEGIVDGDYRVIIPAEVTTLMADPSDLVVTIFLEVDDVEVAISTASITVKITTTAPAAVEEPAAPVAVKSVLPKTSPFLEDDEDEEESTVSKPHYGSKSTVTTLQRVKKDSDFTSAYSAELVAEAKQTCESQATRKKVDEDACMRMVLALNDTRYAEVVVVSETAEDIYPPFIMGEAEMAGFYENGVPVKSVTPPTTDADVPELPFLLTVPGYAIMILAAVAVGAVLAIGATLLVRQHRTRVIERYINRPSVTSPQYEGQVIGAKAPSSVSSKTASVNDVQTEPHDEPIPAWSGPNVPLRQSAASIGVSRRQSNLAGDEPASS